MAKRDQEAADRAQKLIEEAANAKEAFTALQEQLRRGGRTRAQVVSGMHALLNFFFSMNVADCSPRKHIRPTGERAFETCTTEGTPGIASTNVVWRHIVWWIVTGFTDNLNDLHFPLACCEQLSKCGLRRGQNCERHCPSTVKSYGLERIHHQFDTHLASVSKRSVSRRMKLDAALTTLGQLSGAKPECSSSIASTRRWQVGSLIDSLIHNLEVANGHHHCASSSS
ncbi:hypothetical protein JB92DRAFT_1207955 [Gautieria morchelliformis]|nr:hypothetical protein JB92DRAFT_1207955 [Gautieria morchelliformis]